MEYPALHVKTFDLPRIAARAAQVKGIGIQNRLGEAKIQTLEDARARRGQLNSLMPQVLAGDRAAIGQAAAVDPERVSKLLDVIYQADEQKQQQITAHVDKLGRIGAGWLQAPPQQQFQSYKMLASQAGDDSEDPPPDRYGPEAIAWVRRQVDLATSVTERLKSQPKPPSGYRQAGAALEAIPGGPADPKVIAANKQYKTKRTALQLNVPALAKWMKISEKEAAEILTQSKGKTPQQQAAILYGKALAATMGDPEEARKLTEQGMKFLEQYAQGGTPPAAPPTEAAESASSGVWDLPGQAFDFLKGAVSPRASTVEAQTTVPIPPEQGAAPEGSASAGPIGQKFTIEGREVEVMGVETDGSLKVRDTATGRTGTVRR